MNQRSVDRASTSEDFTRARIVFERALNEPADQRTGFVRDACGDDQDLFEAVERMLQADAVRHPLLDDGPRLSADRLSPGEIFASHYRIVRLIGRGGMGEVYQAHDGALGRSVALKVLPPSVAAGAEWADDRGARFRREAQVLASLNHPNIATIHGLEEADGIRALVLELVEGPTLADRIAAGPLGIDETVAIAHQIAVALEVAHDRGIVHRDLKPANVKLRPDRTVKVLDFGLAKVASSASTDIVTDTSPTITSPSLIARGVLLGTPAYMSPEQAKGHEADRRSDIWAFGVLLYEMLTGRRAFKGDDIAETLAAVLRADIAWADLPPATPPVLRQLLGRCLDRDASRRLRDIGEARIVLDDLSAGRSRAADKANERAYASQLKPFVAPVATAIVAGTAVALVLWPDPPSVAPVTRFTLSMPDDRALLIDPQSRDLSITADGTRVIYKGGSGVDRNQLFVYPLDQLGAQPLTSPGLPKGPFPSPDGQWIGFFEPNPGGAILKKVAAGGGPAIPVSRLDGPSRGATWGEKDVIIAASGATATGLLRIAPAGGDVSVLTRPNRDRGENDHLWPQFLPGGTHVLFTITPQQGGMDAAQVAVLDLASGSWTPVIPGGSQAQYVESGHLVYVAGRALWAVPFDLGALKSSGSPRLVVPEIATLSTGTAEFDISRDGTLVYVGGDSDTTAPRELVWVDRQGAEYPINAPPRLYANVRLSPDQTQVATEIEDLENDIWVWHLQRETLTRVTTDPGADESPVWMPDGKRLIFTSQIGGVLGSLFWQAADGSGTPERLARPSSGDDRFQRGLDVLPDGSGILFSEGFGPSVLRLGAAPRIERLTRPSQYGGDGVLSPDGRWVAYVEAPRTPQIFVSAFPNFGESRMQVSTAGGSEPRWAPDGREIFYRGLDGAVMGAPTVLGPSLRVGAPTRVIDAPYYGGLTLISRWGTYDVSRDGQRFLMIKSRTARDGSRRNATVVVVRNWIEELKMLDRTATRP